MVKNYSIRRAVRRIISTHQTGWGRSMGRMTYNLELECGHQQLRPESRPVKGKIVCFECSLEFMKGELRKDKDSV